jgi:two-component system OmpR family response regulator
LTVAGRPVELTALEFRTLAHLMRHQEQVVSKTELTEHLYDQEFDRDSNVIEVLINRLRNKLGAGLIRTRRGLGYQLIKPEDDA